jgi:hypothetical protein
MFQNYIYVCVCVCVCVVYKAVEITQVFKQGWQNTKHASKGHVSYSHDHEVSIILATVI